MGNKFAIVTVHAGDLKNLNKTIKSVNEQSIKPNLHLIIVKNYNPLILKNKKKYNQFIFNKDKSIYNAMNIGLKYTKEYAVMFLNSGDIFYSINTIKLIKKKIRIYNKNCLLFKTNLKYGKNIFSIKGKIFDKENFYSHPSFIRPPDKKIINFCENLKILADGIWMKKNAKKFGIKKIKNVSTTHILGGVSSNPSLYSIKDNFKFSFITGIKESIKFIMISIFKKERYYEIIYKNNFEKK